MHCKFLGDEVYHAKNNAMFATECHTINQSWVEEFPSYCSSGLLINFIDHHNNNITGYLTKYDGIVTDVSSFDNCGTDSTFSLPHSMALLVRSKHGIKRKEYSGPFKALESDKDKISILFCFFVNKDDC